MTDSQIQEYYSGLLIRQYSDKPNAIAHIQALAGALVLGQVVDAVQNAYNPSTAIGTQLQILGKYAGVSSTGNTFNGPTTLDDDDFRIIIQLASIRNTSDGTLASLQTALKNFFSGVIRLYDYADMSISYQVDPGTFSSQLAEFAILQGVFTKPMGVRLRTTILSPIDTAFYGFVRYNNPVPFTQSPFGRYNSYAPGHPWLRYSDGVGSGVPVPSGGDLLTESGDVIETEGGSPISLE